MSVVCLCNVVLILGIASSTTSCIVHRASNIVHRASSLAWSMQHFLTYVLKAWKRSKPTSMVPWWDWEQRKRPVRLSEATTNDLKLLFIYLHASYDFDISRCWKNFKNFKNFIFFRILLHCIVFCTYNFSLSAVAMAYLLGNMKRTVSTRQVTEIRHKMVKSSSANQFFLQTTPTMIVIGTFLILGSFWVYSNVNK